MAGKVSVSEILSAWFSALGRHGAVAAMTGGLITAAGTLADLLLGETGGGLATSVVTFFISYHFVEYILRQDGLTASDLRGRHYGAAFGAALLSGLGILVGMLLLVLPGLYVAARWSLANPLVIGEGMGATAALRESWERTADSAWPIMGALLVLGLGVIAAFFLLGGASVLAGAGSAQPGFVATLASNAIGGAGQVLAGTFGAALYALLGRPSGRLDNIFA